MLQKPPLAPPAAALTPQPKARSTRKLPGAFSATFPQLPASLPSSCFLVSVPAGPVMSASSTRLPAGSAAQRAASAGVRAATLAAKSRLAFCGGPGARRDRELTAHARNGFRVRSSSHLCKHASTHPHCRLTPAATRNARTIPGQRLHLFFDAAPHRAARTGP
jgi:hypothetical protein